MKNFIDKMLFYSQIACTDENSNAYLLYVSLFIMFDKNLVLIINHFNATNAI